MRRKFISNNTLTILRVHNLCYKAMKSKLQTARWQVCFAFMNFAKCENG